MPRMRFLCPSDEILSKVNPSAFLTTLFAGTRAVGFVWLAWLCACTTSLEQPDGARISCGSADECPANYTCANGTCEPNNGNAPPSVIVASVSDSKTKVILPLIVFDPEGDVVHVSAALGRGDGAVALGVEADVIAAPDGTRFDLEWDAATYYHSSARVADLVVTITPRDRYHAGSAVDAPSFVFGNNPPVISMPAFAMGNYVAAGVISIRVSVFDDGELLHLSQFAIVPADGGAEIDVPLDADNFPEGSSDNIASSVSGREHILRWDTGRSAAWSQRKVSLRLAFSDELGDTSNAVESPVFTIDNAPVVRASLAEMTGATRRLNVVQGDVVVTDPNGHLADLTANYRVGEGEWRPATFALTMPLTGESVPSTGLAADGSGYVFVWDALADAAADPLLASSTVVTAASGAQHEVLTFVPSVTLRFSARDAAALESVAADLGPFALGDDAPKVMFGTVGESTLQVALPLSLDDTSSDVANIELEFCAPDEGPCSISAPPATLGWHAARDRFWVDGWCQDGVLGATHGAMGRSCRLQCGRERAARIRRKERRVGRAACPGS